MPRKPQLIKFPRWKSLVLAAFFSAIAAAVVCGCSRPVGDEEIYPRRTVTIVCPWAAGGGTDLNSRFWADALEKEFGKPFVVINHTGGSGAVGHSTGALAKPDGHTITMITAELSTMSEMGITDLTYRDYECVMQVNADAAAIIVHNDAPWKTLGELIEYIRANPGKLKMSGTATGGTWDLARAGMLRAADLPVSSVIWVPSQGSKPALTSLAGKHVDAVCCSVPEAAQQVDAGELRVLAVMSDERLDDFPGIPTCKEAGVDWAAVGWRGLAVPKNTPPEIVQILAEKCEKIASSDEYRKFMTDNKFGIKIRGPVEFTSFLQQQEDQWRPVVEAAGYTPGHNNDPGPRAFPLVLGICLVVGVAIELGRSSVKLFQRQDREPLTNTLDKSPDVESAPAQDFSAMGVANFLILVAALSAYLVLMPWLGFSLSTLLFSTLLMWRLGVRPYWAALLSIALIVAIRMLFVWVFKVQLPEGVLQFLFG